MEYQYEPTPVPHEQSADKIVRQCFALMRQYEHLLPHSVNDSPGSLPLFFGELIQSLIAQKLSTEQQITEAEQREQTAIQQRDTWRAQAERMGRALLHLQRAFQEVIG